MSDARTPEMYWPIQTGAIVLTLSVAGYGAMGWLDAGQTFKALLCVVAQFLANGCVLLSRRAFVKAMPWMGCAMLIAAAGCAYWSGLSLHHAWTADGTDVSPAMIGFLALLEPVLFLGAEHIKQGERPAPAANSEPLAGRSEPARFGNVVRLAATGAAGALALASTGAPGQAEPARAALSEPARPPTRKPARATSPPDRLVAAVVETYRATSSVRAAAKSAGIGRTKATTLLAQAGVIVKEAAA